VEAEEPPAAAPQAAPTPKKAPAGKPWQRIDGCTWKADRWNDGDSFHVLTGIEPPEIVARLYFVDTPEAETAYRDRIAEQAAYFGITPEQAREIAREASAFTNKQLSKPFTVWTRWHKALGRSALGRKYCIIITADGRDLNELLVEAGLARIYGVRTALFDGRNSRQYLERLAELEAEAKTAKRGAWGEVDAEE
jgi:endonuclease YncB( thermonuclease family)